MGSIDHDERKEIKMKFTVPAWVLTLSALTILTACGGGGGGAGQNLIPPGNSSAASLFGVAATGLPVVNGTVTVRCVTAFVGTTTTGADGTWSMTIPDNAVPCAIRVEGGTVNGVPLASPIHSVTRSMGNVNVTPITDLIVANIAGQNPNTWFQSVDNTHLAIDATTIKINNAITAVQSVLASLPGNVAIPNGFNPISTPFAANQVDAGDVLLDNYANGLLTAGITRQQANEAVASGGTALTIENQTLLIYGPTADRVSMVSFPSNITATSGASTIITISDPARGNRTATITSRNQYGDVSDFQSTDFNDVISFYGNRVGAMCIHGNYGSDYDDGRRGYYVYMTDEWQEVTDESEVANKLFITYYGCAERGNAYMPRGDGMFNSYYGYSIVNGERQWDGGQIYAFSDYPGIDCVWSYETEQCVEDVDAGTVHITIRYYKATINGVTKYVMIHNGLDRVSLGVSED